MKAAGQVRDSSQLVKRMTDYITDRMCKGFGTTLRPAQMDARCKAAIETRVQSALDQNNLNEKQKGVFAVTVERFTASTINKALNAVISAKGTGQKYLHFNDTPFANSFLRRYVSNPQGDGDKIKYSSPLYAESRAMTYMEAIDEAAKHAKEVSGGSGLEPLPGPTPPVIAPPNVINFANLGTPKFALQFIRLYKDLMERADESKRFGMDPAANRFREDVGKNLIDKVKAMFRIAPTATDDEIREARVLDDNAAKRLAKNLGHDAKPAVEIREVKPDARYIADRNPDRCIAVARHRTGDPSGQ